jgi:hypothetical protein
MSKDKKIAESEPGLITFAPPEASAGDYDRRFPAMKKISGYSFLPAPDALWRYASAPYVARYAVLGIPVEIAANAPALADLAERTFGGWRSCEADETPRVRLRLFLHDTPEPAQPAGCPIPVFRMQGPYFMLAVGNSFTFADMATGFGTAFLTPALLADAGFVRVGVLECLVLYLAGRYRQGAIHAAAVLSEGRCVLLAGECGAGKSTLAYACLRAGMRLIADDVVYLEAQDGALSVWGNPWLLHLTPDTARFYPELRAMQPTRELSGEHKILLDVRARWPGRAEPHSRVHAVLTLGRAEGRMSRIVPADAACARNTLAHFRHNVDPEEAAAMLDAADRLLSLRHAHLEVGSDLDQAVELVRRWLAA